MGGDAAMAQPAATGDTGVEAVVVTGTLLRRKQEDMAKEDAPPAP